MGEVLILETSFLIDLERESRRRQAGPAQRFLALSNGSPRDVPAACGRSTKKTTEWVASDGISVLTFWLICGRKILCPSSASRVPCFHHLPHLCFL